MTVQTVYKGYSSYLTVEPGYTGGISASSRRQAAPLEPMPQTSPAVANSTTNDSVSTPYRTAIRATGSMQETGRYHPWEEVDHARSVWVSQELDKHASDRTKGPVTDRGLPVVMADIRFAGYRYIDTGGVESGEKRFHGDVALVKDSVRFATTSVDRDVATFDGRQFEMDREGGDPEAVWEAIKDVPMPDMLDTELNRLNTARSDAANASEMPSWTPNSDAAEPHMNPGQISSDFTNSQYTINTEQIRSGNEAVPGASLSFRADDQRASDGNTDPSGKQIAGVLLRDENGMPTGLPEPPAAKIVLKQDIHDLTQAINEPDGNLRFKDKTFPGPDRKSLEMLRRNQVENFEGAPKVRDTVDTAYITQPYLAGMSDRKSWRELTGPSMMGIEPVDIKAQAIPDKEVAAAGRVWTRSIQPEILENTYSGERFTRNRLGIAFDSTPLTVDYGPLPGGQGGGELRSDIPGDRLIHPAPDGRVDLGSRVRLEGPAAMNRSHARVDQGAIRHEQERLGTLVPDRMAKKITESSLFGRNDPRIQEVIVMTERIDPFGLMDSVSQLVSSAAGDARYGARGVRDAVMVKGQILDRLGLDWGGGQVQSTSHA